MGRPLSKPRPKQGARLVQLRRDAGLTQTELAELVGEPQANIAFWERSAKPPRSDVLPKLARILSVRVEDLLDVGTPLPQRRSGPVGRVAQVFNEVRKLPRRQQEKVADVVAALVEQYRRKAS
jgi:transcriptional regulator with XRE-family HTH domain